MERLNRSSSFQHRSYLCFILHCVGREFWYSQKEWYFPLALFSKLSQILLCHIDHCKCCQLSLTSDHQQSVTLSVHLKFHLTKSMKICIGEGNCIGTYHLQNFILIGQGILFLHMYVTLQTILLTWILLSGGGSGSYSHS